ncbi:MAG TPA: hypothetical protein VF885_05845 [Arthrobacter sp.]
MMPELQDGEVDVRIRTPLPGSVVLTLGRLMDAAWPGTQLVDGEQGEVTFRINNTTRSAVTDTDASALRVEPEEEDLNIHALGPSGIRLANPVELAASMLPVMKTSFGDNPDAVNYLETAIRDPESGARYVLIFAKSAAQTPHELRTRAEENLTRAREEAQAVNTAAVQKLLQAPRHGKPDSFEAGVKAALDAMRQANFANTPE